MDFDSVKKGRGGPRKKSNLKHRSQAAYKAEWKAKKRAAASEIPPDAIV